MRETLEGPICINLDCMVWTTARESLMRSTNICRSTCVHSVRYVTLGMPEDSVRQCFPNTSACRNHSGEPSKDFTARATPRALSGSRCGTQASGFWKLSGDSTGRQFLNHCHKEIITQLQVIHPENGIAIKLAHSHLAKQLGDSKLNRSGERSSPSHERSTLRIRWWAPPAKGPGIRCRRGEKGAPFILEFRQV